MIELNYS